MPPCRATRSAVALPMPEDAPVMTTVLPVSALVLALSALMSGSRFCSQ